MCTSSPSFGDCCRRGQEEDKVVSWQYEGDEVKDGHSNWWGVRGDEALVLNAGDVLGGACQGLNTTAHIPVQQLHVLGL